MKQTYDFPRMSELIESGMKDTPLRELARNMDIPVASLHNYLTMGTEPRLSALAKMATYFRVSIAELMGEIDEIDGAILKITRKMTKKQKRELLEELKK